VQRVAERLAAHRQRLTALAATLDSVSPYAVLQRGYALLRDPHTHAVLTRAAQFSANQPIEIVLATAHSAPPLRRLCTMMNAQSEPMTFEQALTRLEAIVRTLESGELPLEETVRLYERGNATKIL
jgi:hypothetical protein